MEELHGEKIDIVQYDEDPETFIINALAPAKILQVSLYEEDGNNVAEVVVPDNQLPLAIGRSGQNARLAAKLTGWHIDIKSASQAGTYSEKAEADLAESIDALTERALAKMASAQAEEQAAETMSDSETDAASNDEKAEKTELEQAEE